jgi:ribose transport system permease protein
MDVNKSTSNTRKKDKLMARGAQKRRFKITTELVLFLINLVVFIFMSIYTENFLTQYNISNVFRQVSIIGVVAISSTLVIISGGIDLSVGSIVGLTAMISAVLMSESYQNMAILPAVILAIISGLLVGVYHGFIIYEIKLPPFIATLGSMFVVRGIVKMISGARTIAHLPNAFTDFAQQDVFGVPGLVILWLSIALIVHFILRHTTFGRNIFVIGSSQEVARLSGIRMRLNVYGIYIFAGLLCSIAGVMLSSRISSAVPTGGTGYELTAIAAAVIGGASLSGARGSVLGTLMGTLLMGLITNVGVHLNIDPFLMQSITGALLTIAVVIDQFRQRDEN